MILLYITIKDLIISWRRIENFISVSVFSLILFVIYQFSFFENAKAQTSTIAGVFWSVFVISFIFNLQQLQHIENERNCMTMLNLAPVSRSSIFTGKFFSNFLYNTISFLTLFPIYLLFFTQKVEIPILQFFTIFLFTNFGCCSLGTLFSIMTNKVKLNQLLVPILLYPLITPILLASIFLTVSILQGNDLSISNDWFKLILGFDIIFFVVSFTISDLIK